MSNEQVNALKEVIVQQAANMTEMQRQLVQTQGQLQQVAAVAQQLQESNKELKAECEKKQAANDERMGEITALRGVLDAAGIKVEREKEGYRWVQKVLTEADAAADLAGAPRPDNPTPKPAAANDAESEGGEAA